MLYTELLKKPRFKQPPTLHTVALLRVQDLLLKTCVHIEQRPTRYRAICQVQDYLFNNIGSFIDEVGSSTINRMMNRTFLECISYVVPIDGRILMSLFSHSETRSFMYHNNRLCDTEIEYIGSVMFWANKIKIMTHLVKLNITNVEEPQGVFKAIGESCKNLKELIFRSNYLGKKDQYFKMKHLINCPKLHIIYDVTTRFLSYEVDLLRDFIKKMPQLTVFNAYNLGSILSSGMEDMTTPLLLTKAIETNPTHLSIQALADQCPHLKSLQLESNKDLNEDYDMTAFSEYTFQLTELSLETFRFKNVINICLKNKGYLLTSLSMKHCKLNGPRLSKWDIIKIGMFCPNLKYLQMHYQQTGEGEETPPSDEEQHDGERPLFRKLTTLVLRGVLCWEQGIVELCLKCATSINTIVIEDRISKNWKYTGGALIDLSNPMTELQYLNVTCAVMPLSPESALTFFQRFLDVENMSLRYAMNDDPTISVPHILDILNTMYDHNFHKCIIFSFNV